MAKKIKVEMKSSRRWLRVNLTNEELLAAGKLHADRSIEFAALENDRKRIADEFKAKTSAIEAEACALAAKISSGYEFRYVPCTEYLGFSSTQGVLHGSKASYWESYCIAKCTCLVEGRCGSMGLMKGKSI